MPNELDKFLEGLEDDQDRGVDILNQPLDGTTEVAEPTEPTTTLAEDTEDDDGEFKPKNRREKRLLKRLEDERNSASFLAGKLEAMSAAKNEITSAEADYLKGIERIYGTETPEAQMATEILRNALIGARDDAEKRAMERWQEQQQEEERAEQRAESELEAMIDDIEDTYNVDLTPEQEKNFFKLLEKMSPKDANKNIVGYADPHAVWEVFAERSKRTNSNGNRAKQLSSRSMTKGTEPTASTLENDATVRFLKDSGII